MSKPRAYYNEIDTAAAHVLECLVKDGVIADGDVDRRSIRDVSASDISPYTQCHFFAGGGLWSVAIRLAGWSDDRPIWTGSCPCQPFSVAGKGAAENDPRHLWPDFFRLIRTARPAVVVGEQVAGAAGYRWFDGVRSDLEGENYASRAVDIPAISVNAPHIRQRLYWCALEHSQGIGWREGRPKYEFWSGRSAVAGTGGKSDVADADSGGRGRRPEASECEQEGRTSVEWSGGDLGDTDCSGQRELCGTEPIQPQLASSQCAGGNSFWSDYEWLIGADRKTRRSKPGIRLLVDGFPNRVAAIRIAGNAIVAPLATEVIKALMETIDER